MSKIQVDEIYDQEGSGGPRLPNGAVVSGVLTATSFKGDGSEITGVSIQGSTNINTTGIVTATSVNTTTFTSTNVSVASSVTAVAFFGDGSGLTFAPRVIAFDPGALSTNVAVDKTITISFDQDIQFSGSGTIQLRTGSASGSIIESFAISSGSPAAGLSISGTQLIINPTSNLSINTNIYVVIPSQGIANAEGTYYAGTSSYNFSTVLQSFTAQGGDFVQNIVSPTSPTGYHKYHIFTNPGILTTSQNTNQANDFAFMLIGGGGGGAWWNPYPDPDNHGGGGGAGGYITKDGPGLGLQAGNYTITIGAGGNGGSPTNSNNNNNNGNQSTVISPSFSLIAYGGGGGGGSPGPDSGKAGASGGGAGAAWNESGNANVGGQGLNGQGNPGGNAVSSNMFPPTPPGPYIESASGGGGGSGGAGRTGQMYPSPTYPNTEGRAGDGGLGTRNPAFDGDVLSSRVPNSIIPTNTWQLLGPTNDYWAGGGAGNADYAGMGGYGGGGSPQEDNPSTNPSVPAGPIPYVPGRPRSGADGTGGGGGGGRDSTPGGDGGNGVLMIRYAAPSSG